MTKYLAQITGQLRADDLIVMFDNLVGATVFVSQTGFTDDGYRIIQFESGNGSALRDGSKAVLRTKTGSVEYVTLAEAQAAAELLDPSDWYDILDLEQPVGSANTLYVERRPSLWSADYTDELGNSYVDSRVNGWGRTDLDRI